jgi:hypothetical protein
MSAESSSSAKVSLSDLWESVPAVAGVFLPANVADVPQPARRYLVQALNRLDDSPRNCRSARNGCTHEPDR